MIDAMTKTTRSIDHLPTSLPILAKDGLVLLPRGHLPIHVSEPKNVRMIECALKENRLIAVVQPIDDDMSDLFKSGCLGRITTMTETAYGYFIVLTGVCRLDILEELPPIDDCRRICVSYQRYENDLTEDKKNSEPIDRPRLIAALRQFLQNNDIIANWEEIISTSDEKLVTAIAMAGPFSPQEKQAMLESITLTERCCIITTLIEMASLDVEGSDVTRH
jgi:Lon protease-like protein